MNTIDAKRRHRAGRTRHSVKLAARRNDRLRLSIYRSNEHIYAQIIDDTAGTTVVSASTLDKKLRTELAQLKSAEQAVKVGQAIAERAQQAGVTDVYFDRGGYRYMGRIKALGDAARAGGLNF